MSGASPPGPIVLIGAGRMGGAMLQGWLASTFDPALLVVVDPQPGPSVIEAAKRRGIHLNPGLHTLPALAALVLAIKPQAMAQALDQLSDLPGSETLVLSIMAGKTIEDIARHLPKARAIVRAMPNMPASVGRGITVAVANQAATLGQTSLADALLRAVGRVEWIEDEGLMNAVTAVSGSGPAYVFHLVEALAEAGVKAGLPPSLAMALARETTTGSGELLFRSQETAQSLREAVTSPGGTTAAALEILMSSKGLTPLMIEAVRAAKKRAAELAGS